jgi:hypothetical protein
MEPYKRAAEMLTGAQEQLNSINSSSSRLSRIQRRRRMKYRGHNTGAENTGDKD